VWKERNKERRKKQKLIKVTTNVGASNARELIKVVQVDGFRFQAA